MVVLDNLDVIEFSGADAADFLHRQLSADILALAPGECTFACLCIPKGRVQALLLVQARDTSLRCLCAARLAGTVAQNLRRFVFRDDVTITERTDLAVLGVEAPEQAELLTRTGLGYAVAPRGESTPEAGRARAWKQRELEMGVAWLDEVSSEAFLPQALGYERIGALSFRKGCYPGQEIVARTRYLGRLKRRAVTLRVEGVAELVPMQRVTLAGDGHEAVADLVDSAGDVLYLVARSAEVFEIERALVDQRPFRVLSSAWDQASATT